MVLSPLRVRKTSAWLPPCWRVTCGEAGLTLRLATYHTVRRAFAHRQDFANSLVRPRPALAGLAPARPACRPFFGDWPAAAVLGQTLSFCGQPGLPGRSLGGSAIGPPSRRNALPFRSASATVRWARSSNRPMVPRETPMRFPASSCESPSTSANRSASSSSKPSTTSSRNGSGMPRGLK